MCRVESCVGKEIAPPKKAWFDYNPLGKSPNKSRCKSHFLPGIASMREKPPPSGDISAMWPPPPVALQYPHLPPWGERTSSTLISTQAFFSLWYGKFFTLFLVCSACMLCTEDYKKISHLCFPIFPISSRLLDTKKHPCIQTPNLLQHILPSNF